MVQIVFPQLLDSLEFVSSVYELYTMKYKLVIFGLFLLNLFNSEGQITKGSVSFEDGSTNFDFLIIEFGVTKTLCDSIGNFILKRNTVMTEMDTLIVRPFPEYIKVKVINIPSNNDTISLSRIPLFNNVDNGFPVINFKSKRASKKYFKNLEKKQQEEEAILKKEIEDSIFHWNGIGYKLRLEKDDMENIVIIDLKK